MTPDASGFLRDLERKLQAMRDPGFDVRVGADTSNATEDTDAFRAEQRRRAVELNVDVDTASASAAMDAWRSTQEARHLTIEVDVDTSRAEAALARMGGGGGRGGGFGGGGRGGGGGFGGALKFNAAALGIGELPAAAAALGTVASALQQVSQAGLVVPGVFGGIAASAGTAALGFKDMGDAYKSFDTTLGPKAMEKAQAAMAGLAPAARSVLVAVHDLTPEFEGLQRLVAQNMFDGVDKSINQLAASTLPTLQKGLGGIGTAWNQTFKEIARVGGSGSSLNIMDRIFGNTADAQARANAAIDPLVKGLGTLVAAGSDSLPRLADGLTAVSQRFSSFITAADQDGRLGKWIDEGLDGLTNLGNAALNIGKTFTAITSAAGGGGDFLKWLADSSDRLQTFLNSTQGQNTLKEFFAEGREQLSQLLPLLQNIASLFGDVYDASKQWSGVLIPALTTITDMLTALPDGALSSLLVGFLAFKTLAPFAGLISGLDMLTGRLGAADTKAGGLRTKLGGIGPAVAVGAAGLVAGDALLDPTNPDGTSRDPSAGQALGGLAANVGGGAIAGGMVAGAPGAIAGAIAGLGISIYERVANEIKQGQTEWERQWQADHDAGPNRPGSDERANRLTGRDKILQPSLNTPKISASLIPAIQAGRVPGFSVGPDGQILGPDGPVNLPGSLLPGRKIPGAGLAAAAAAKAPPVSIPPPTVGGVPFPTVPGAAQPPKPSPYLPVGPDGRPLTPGSGGPASAIPRGTNPLLAGPVAAGVDKVNASVQETIASVGILARDITALPNGSLQIKDQTPEVIEKLKDLGLAVQQLPEGKIVIRVQYIDPLGKLAEIGAGSSIGAPLNLPARPVGGYKQGSRGVTPGGRNQGFLAELHGQEWVHDAGTVDRYGPDVMNAMWRGRIDPNALRALVPGFKQGGAAASGSTSGQSDSFWDQLVGGTKVAAGQIGSAYNFIDTLGGGYPTIQEKDPRTGQMMTLPPPQVLGVGGVKSAIGEGLARIAGTVGDDAAAAAPRGVSLSRSPAYTKSNIPLTPENYYRGVNVKSLEDLFDPSGVMRGYGRGGSESMSFQAGAPNDLYVNGITKSNMIIEGGPNLPILSQEARSGYTYVDQISREAMESGQIPMRVFTRSPADDGQIHSVHEWEKIFDSFPGFAGGGAVIDAFGNPVTPGPAPGPATIAPNPSGGGVTSAVSSFLSALPGPLGQVSGLLGGATDPGDASGAGTGQKLTPGLWGLAQAGNDPDLLKQWTDQTGDYLANFGASTLNKFGSALWKGALGFFGLENSILSPDNIYNQSAQKTAGFFLGADGPFGGQDGNATAKAPTPKQIREANDRVTNTKGSLAAAQARMAELKPEAKESTRISASNSLANAQREAEEAVADLAALQSGSTTASSSYLASESTPPTETPTGSGAERWRSTVRQALQQYGPQFGITNITAWEDAMVRQIATESGGDPAAYNGNDGDGRGGHQVVAGIGQFLKSTFDANNITGGAYMDPQSQIAAMIPYVSRRYGVDSAGAPKGIGQGHGYATGGGVAGYGRGDTVPAMLTPGEHVLTTADVAKMGGQDSVYQFRNALHMAVGGQVKQGAVPPRPNFDTPDAQEIKPRPPAPAPRRPVATPPPAPTPAAPPPVSAPAPPAAAPPAAQTAPAPPPPMVSMASGGSGGGAAGTKHTLPWVDQAIESTASTLGNIASTAASAAAGGAGGGGGAGALIGGLFQQGGKIAQGVANVISSSLVGSVPGSFGNPDGPVYGTPNIAPQNRPMTAPGRFGQFGAGGGNQYTFNGYDSRDVFQMAQNNESLQRQAILATTRG